MVRENCLVGGEDQKIMNPNPALQPPAATSRAAVADPALGGITRMAFLDKLKRMVQEPQPPHASTPREECDALLDEPIKMALRLIEAHGSHIPFCLAITTAGERTNIAADDTEIRDADVLFESVRQHALTAIRDRQIRAVALANNVRYHRADDSTPRESIQVTIDHLRDRACTCYLPYRITGGRVVPEELFTTDPVERLFTDNTTFIAGSGGEVTTL